MRIRKKFKSKRFKDGQSIVGASKRIHSVVNEVIKEMKRGYLESQPVKGASMPRNTPTSSPFAHPPAKTMAKTQEKGKGKEKESLKGKKKEPMRQVSLHEIRKPESKHRKLPWLKRPENTAESSTNPVPSTSQPVEEDIYSQPPCKDGIYMSKWI